MRRLASDRLLDCSTVEEFRFFLPCGECGRIWKSRPARFSRAGLQPETEGKRVIYRTLYERERAEARTAAETELFQSFNLCPICGRLVCDDCFRVCEDLDLCAACAERLQIHGEPVGRMERPG